MASSSAACFHSRVRLFQKRLRELKISAALVTHGPNARYLSGFTGSSVALVIDRSGPTLFTDGRYSEQAAREAGHSRIEVASRPLTAALEFLKTRFKAAIGFEGNHLAFSDYTRFRETVGNRATLRDLGDFLEQSRMVKDEWEMPMVRAAARLGSSLFQVALKSLKAGVAETRVAAEMEFAARHRGAEGMSFSTIVASGRRSALPHGRASGARIPRSGFVVLDFGVILCGYCSDMTRTVHVGKPSEAARAMYVAVREAQTAAIEAVRPGRTFEQVDEAARNVLRKRGLAEFFTHSTGHGVGLEIHEPPRLGVGQKGHLKAGMVVTIEPGVYIPGKGGVRIEDMVLVTKKGHKVLTRGPKELLVV